MQNKGTAMLEQQASARIATCYFLELIAWTTLCFYFQHFCIHQFLSF